MKPNPFVALAGSRKVIVSLGALVAVAALHLLWKGTQEGLTVATGAVVALAWKLMGAIAVEDAAAKSAPDPVTIPIAVDDDPTLTDARKP